MKIIEVSTKGFTDIVEITDEIQRVIDQGKIKEGVCHLFVILTPYQEREK